MIRRLLARPLDWRLGAVIARLDALSGRAEGLDGRLQSLDARLAELAAELGEVRGQTAAVAQIAESATTTRLTLEQRIEPLVRAIADEEAENRRRLHALRARADYEQAYVDPDPLVSITVPTRGRTQLLTERALPSLLAQTHANLEILVVGDAAAPELEQAVLALGDPRIRYANLSQRISAHPDPRRHWLVGSTMARNEAARRASGRWLLHFDDDDHLRPDTLASLLRVAHEQRAEVAYGGFEEHHPDGAGSTGLGFPPRLGCFSWAGALVHTGLRFFERELIAAHLELPGRHVHARAHAAGRRALRAARRGRARLLPLDPVAGTRIVPGGGANGLEHRARRRQRGDTGGGARARPAEHRALCRGPPQPGVRQPARLATGPAGPELRDLLDTPDGEWIGVPRAGRDGRAGSAAGVLQSGDADDPQRAVAVRVGPRALCSEPPRTSLRRKRGVRHQGPLGSALAPPRGGERPGQRPARPRDPRGAARALLSGAGLHPHRAHGCRSPGRLLLARPALASVVAGHRRDGPTGRANALQLRRDRGLPPRAGSGRAVLGAADPGAGRGRARHHLRGADRQLRADDRAGRELHIAGPRASPCRRPASGE